jgi:hypothetical protein
MSFNGRQQQQHNHQLLQYFCSKCGILLKETEEESLIDNKKNSINASNSNNRTISKVWFSIII